MVKSCYSLNHAIINLVINRLLCIDFTVRLYYINYIYFLIKKTSFLIDVSNIVLKYIVFAVCQQFDIVVRFSCIILT